MTAPGVPDSPEVVAAKLAITEVMAMYCRGIDRMDRELVSSAWHPDGTCAYDEFYEGDVAGFIDAVWAAHEGMWRHTHQIANSVIKVDGNRAVSETYVTATMWGNPTDDAMMELVAKARYLDRWSNRDGRWALDHRAEVGDMTTVHTLKPGAWFMASKLAKRDRDDASYALFSRSVDGSE